MSATLIVTGASGKLGRTVIRHLQGIHGGPIIAATRDPGRIADLEGVEPRRADFDDPGSLAAAFSGGTRMLLVSTDAVGGGGRRIAQHQAAIDAAARAGVEHIVYTSLTRPEPGAVITIAPDHFATEQALKASGLGWTALRDNLYADLWLEFLTPALRSGILAAAAGEGGVGWVTREDCARTAAAVLTTPPTGSSVLDVTGPAPVTYREVAAMASRLSGRRIEYQPVSATEASAGMQKAGLPAHVIELLVSFQLATARGELAVVSNTVAGRTGRAPLDVETFLSGHRARLEGTP